LLLLVAAFILSRLVTFFFVFQPLALGSSFGDLEKYESWGTAVLDDPASAYSSNDLEYPPGVLPFLSFARSVTPPEGGFTQSFAWTMLLVDIASFAGVILLWRRWGAAWGPLVWILGLPALGPVIYLRLDLIPTACLIWAMVAAAHGWWRSSGGALGLGVLAKVYPVFLVPVFFVASPRRKQLLVGLAVSAGVILVPLVIAGEVPALIADVAGYHGARGVQLESTWGSLLVLASKFGYPVTLNYQFGSLEALSGISQTLKTAGLGLSLIAVGWISWSAFLKLRQGDLVKLSLIVFGTIAILLFLGTVYSPQFSVWLLGAAAVALCAPLPPNLRAVLMLSLPVALLTQAVFPHTYAALFGPFFGDDHGLRHSVALTVLLARNLLVGAAGALTLLMTQRWSPDQP
jgi:hypothetical protein